MMVWIGAAGICLTLFYSWQLRQPTVQHKHYTTVTANALASEGLGDFALAIQAATNNDTAAVTSLVSQGRVCILLAGTKVNGEDSANKGVAIVSVESGSHIGETLYVGSNSLK